MGAKQARQPRLRLVVRPHVTSSVDCKATDFRKRECPTRAIPDEAGQRGERSNGSRKKMEVFGNARMAENRARKGAMPGSIRSRWRLIRDKSVPAGIGPTPDEPASVISTGNLAVRVSSESRIACTCERTGSGISATMKERCSIISTLASPRSQRGRFAVKIERFPPAQAAQQIDQSRWRAIQPRILNRHLASYP